MPYRLSIEQSRNEWRDLVSYSMKIAQSGASTESDALRMAHALHEIDVYHRRLEILLEKKAGEFRQIDLRSRMLETFFSEAPIGYLILDENEVIQDVNFLQ